MCGKSVATALAACYLRHKRVHFPVLAQECGFMAIDTFHCPECGAMLRHSTNLRPGAEVRCPHCHNTFPAPGDGPAPTASAGSAPPPASTGLEVTTEPGAGLPPSRITNEPLEERDVRRRFADEDDEDYPRSRDEGRRRDPDAPLSNDYTIDLNRWFTYGGAHYTAILGPAAGFVAIFVGISIGLSFVGTIMQMVSGVPLINLGPTVVNQVLIAPLFNAGLAYVCLRQLDGRPWTFADFFAGLRGRYFGNVILNSILMNVLLAPAFGFYMAGIVALTQQAPEFALGFFSAALFAIAVSIYFITRLFYFSLPLILDRGFGVIDAIKGSWTLSENHWWGLILMGILLGLIGMSGLCACYVGALFSLPFATIVQMAGYMDVAGIDPPLRRPAPTQQWRENG
jgi:hypothetical protein